ncbi:MAG TPA: B12-binding domain-containing radical SAM protein, partial [Candidatus Hydrogenedentes bacterium]|nr:B12-binding domain-containing radical SAM protein [Candidatus Hydrogenedentota bacterium]
MYSNRHDMLDTLLTAVEKPSRYIGGEWNSVVKDPARVRLRVALAFPDLYELGLGNLGLQILYSILNAREDIWAERVCLPAPDLAGLLRKNGRPLFLLESRDPLAEADVIGFTLQSELTYANILEMLDLAGLPVRSADRAEDAPLVLAGGPCAVNPEPLAPFIDAFLIGDGEDAIIEIADALIPLRRAPRNRRLDALAEISGVYVPARHPLEYLGGRLLACPEPRVRRRTVIALDRAPFPRNPVVPFTQLIHDGAGIEVLRGCTQGCRFCQAGMITRPVQEREISTIADAVDAILQRTGLESVSLVSLST